MLVRRSWRRNPAQVVSAHLKKRKEQRETADRNMQVDPSNFPSYASSHAEVYTFQEGQIGGFAGLSNYTYATPSDSGNTSDDMCLDDTMESYEVKGADRESALPAVDYSRDEVSSLFDIHTFFSIRILCCFSHSLL